MSRLKRLVLALEDEKSEELEVEETETEEEVVESEETSEEEGEEETPEDSEDEAEDDTSEEVETEEVDVEDSDTDTDETTDDEPEVEDVEELDEEYTEAPEIVDAITELDVQDGSDGVNDVEQQEAMADSLTEQDIQTHSLLAFENMIESGLEVLDQYQELDTQTDKTLDTKIAELPEVDSAEGASLSVEGFGEFVAKAKDSIKKFIKILLETIRKVVSYIRSVLKQDKVGKMVADVKAGKAVPRLTSKKLTPGTWKKLFEAATIDGTPTSIQEITANIKRGFINLKLITNLFTSIQEEFEFLIALMDGKTKDKDTLSKDIETFLERKINAYNNSNFDEPNKTHPEHYQSPKTFRGIQLLANVYPELEEGDIRNNLTVLSSNRLLLSKPQLAGDDVLAIAEKIGEKDFANWTDQNVKNLTAAYKVLEDSHRQIVKVSNYFHAKGKAFAHQLDSMHPLAVKDLDISPQDYVRIIGKTGLNLIANIKQSQDLLDSVDASVVFLLNFFLDWDRGDGKPVE